MPLAEDVSRAAIRSANCQRTSTRQQLALLINIALKPCAPVATRSAAVADIRQESDEAQLAAALHPLAFGLLCAQALRLKRVLVGELLHLRWRRVLGPLLRWEKGTDTGFVR